MPRESPWENPRENGVDMGQIFLRDSPACHLKWVGVLKLQLPRAMNIPINPLPAFFKSRARGHIRFGGAFLLALAVPLLASPVPHEENESGARPAAVARFGELPLRFEQNMGQTPERFDSLARGPGYAVYVSGDEMMIALRAAEARGDSPVRGVGHTQRNKARGEGEGMSVTMLHFTLSGADPTAEKHFSAPLEGETNYIHGSDPGGWHLKVPGYAKLEYRSIYPGVDVIYHGDRRQLEHDFVIAPGSDPKVIEWAVSGMDKMEVNAAGDLNLQTKAGLLRMPKAIAYQNLSSGRREVTVDYELRGTNRVGFTLGSYDSSHPLVIDPVLYYSTFLGGSDYDEAYGVAVDSTGGAYVTGVTFSTNFPTAAALQSGKSVDGDVFVAKLNPAGSALVYCTYLGGNGYDEGSAIAVDGTGAAYVAGVTYSTNFPLKSAVQPTNAGGGDAFLAKLAPGGASLVYSTYFGDTGYDAASAVAVNSAGVACIGGTREIPSRNNSDGFAVKFTAAGTAFTYNVYIGGSGADAIYGLAMDTAGNVYVAGETESRDFPLTSGAFDATYKGAGDAFVAKLNPAGTSYLYSTLLGGSRAEKAYAIAVDTAGNAYVTGETESSDFPMVSPYQSVIHTGGDAFVTKLNPSGTALVYSTCFGGANLDFGTGIAVDAGNAAHVTGYTASLDFPSVRPSQTANGGGGDAFVARFTAAGNSLIYSTFVGGNGIDYANAIAVDSTLVSYIAGYTVSANYPRYLPLQNTYGGVADAFVTKIGNPVVTITATDPTAAEPGTDTGTFTISRTGNPAKALVVNLTTSGTATNGVDYNLTPTSVTIPANSVSTTLTISPIDDLIWEGDETVVMTIAATSNNYTVGSPKAATVTIIDNEIKPAVTIQAVDASASEPGTDTGKFRVTRNTSTVGPLTVNFTVGGTATSGVDYTAIGTSVIIPAGSSTADITVTPLDDTIYEGSETVVAALSTSTLYSLGTPSSATVTIADNEVPPVVTVAPLDAIGSEPGTNTASFRFTRTGGTTQPLTVTYTIGGTATNGADYSTVGTAVTFAIGSTTVDRVISPLDDTLVEGTETVIFTLAAGTGYAVGNPNSATVSILDNEPASGATVTVQATVPNASEAGPQSGQITFTRTGSTASSLSISCTVSGTATNGVDYSGLGSTFTIPAGSASAVATVTPYDDLLIEGSETATVTLVADAAYTIGTPKTATVTIADDDTVKPTVTVVATDPSASETGLDPGTYTFTRTGGSLNVALYVSFTVSGTATSGTDYSGLGSSVIIPAGATTATATLTPYDDLIVEGTETAIVTLATDPIYTIGTPNTATISIADNDGVKPTVTVVASDPNASEPGTDTGTFTFTRTGGDTSVALYVSYVMSGTASAFNDYTGVYSSITIPAGSISATATLTVSDDLLIEGSETAILTLSTDPLYNVGSPNVATVTIADNDSVKPVVTVAATDANASEAGTNTGTYTFTRTGGDLSVTLYVTYAMSGTADPFNDYSGVYSSISIPAGSSTATATLTVYDDLLIEGPETAILTLSPDPNSLYTVGSPSIATVTIADDDTVRPVVTVAATDANASEAGTSTGTFTFTRTGGSLNVPLYITYATTGTASPFNDYSGVYSSVTIPAGSTTATATLTPYDDLLIEGTETAIVTLSPDPSNIYDVGAQNTATVFIADDDTVKPVVTVVATDPTAVEPGTTVNTGTFTFTRTGGSLNVPLYVSFSVSGTASQFSDYSGLGGSVTIPAGSTTATAVVTPYADNIVEGNETVIVTIQPDSSPFVYNVGTPATATVTISD